MNYKYGVHLPDIGLAIAILMNLEGVQDERMDLAGKIAKVILEQMKQHLTLYMKS